MLSGSIQKSPSIILLLYFSPIVLIWLVFFKSIGFFFICQVKNELLGCLVKVASGWVMCQTLIFGKLVTDTMEGYRCSAVTVCIKWPQFDVTLEWCLAVSLRGKCNLCTPRINCTYLIFHSTMDWCFINWESLDCC